MNEIFFLLYHCLFTNTSSTYILFLVSVPVLSVQMYVTEPNVSTAGSLRISVLKRTILLAANAREIVITAGSASGIAATAIEMLVNINLTMFSWRNKPANKNKT